MVLFWAAGCPSDDVADAIGEGEPLARAVEKINTATNGPISHLTPPARPPPGTGPFPRTGA